jgi:hypothetical protein
MNITTIAQLNTTKAVVTDSAEATFIRFPKTEPRSGSGEVDYIVSSQIIAICIKDRTGLQADRWTIKAVDVRISKNSRNTNEGSTSLHDRPLYDGEWATILA